MLGITEWDTKHRKGDKNVRDVERVNNHLADARIAALGIKDGINTRSEQV